VDDLMASLRLVLPDASDLQMRTVVFLVRSVVEREWQAEQARVREMAAARKRRQRAMSRDSHRDSHRDKSVTELENEPQAIAVAPMIPHTKPPPLIASSPPASVGGFGGGVSSGPGLLRLSGDPDPLEARSERDVDVMSVLAHYKRLHPASKLTRQSKEGKLIRDRLAEGYSVEDLCRCIDGYHQSPHHLGENDRRTKYLSLELFVRDSKHVQAGIEFLELPTRQAPPSRNGAAVRAVLALNARRTP